MAAGSSWSRIHCSIAGVRTPQGARALIRIPSAPQSTAVALVRAFNQPFEAVNRTGEFDVWCTVTGGGLSGQAGAVRHGISKALALFEPTIRPALRAGGFLTRDARVVERKKYGKRKARRSFQFSKR